MDIHTQELEEFKSQQNKKTFKISTTISSGIAILGIAVSAIVQIIIKTATQGGG